MALQSDRNDEVVFTIRELADEFDVTLRALRFYGDEALLLPRRRGNRRLYSATDKARLRLILFGRRIGLTIGEVKEILDLYEPRGDNVARMRAVLTKYNEQMTVLRAERERIGAAIEELEEAIGEVEERLRS